MSRIAKQPVIINDGIEVNISGQSITVKGKLGTLTLDVHQSVNISQDDGEIKFAPLNELKTSEAMAGTMRSLVNNMVNGVANGYSKTLQLIGVGYRAQLQGKLLDLSLGFSHPVKYAIPDGISIETPSQTEIIVKGADKQAVGQVCAEIRAFRPPEPYKGKGVRYADEHVIRKQAKKK